MRKVFILSCICAAAFSFASCNNKSNPVYEAIVTVKPDNPDQACFLKVDSKTAVKPTNASFQTNPYKKEVRAYCVYADLGPIEAPAGSDLEWRSCDLAKIDTILTKKPVPAGGKYGDAPIELMNSWMTCFEDGYLTLYFEGLWGDVYSIHTINLEKTEDAFTYYLKHDSKGDTAIYRNRGLIAFDLRDLKLESGKEYDLSLKYTGYLADKTVKFHYKDGVWSRPTTVDVEGHYE